MNLRAFFLMLSVLSITVSAVAYADDDDNTKKKKEETEEQEDTEKTKTVSEPLAPPPSVIPDTPTSPQAQAFVRLGEYTMNNSSGIPDIGLPLFQIDFYGYTIPLNLRYEANPLKPGYNYDVFGLGWTLTGSSCVSRVIHDRADEVGRYGNPFELDSFEEQNHTMRVFKNYSSELDKFNFQYDSYTITLPSGRNIPFFMYKSNGLMTYHLLSPDANVKIVCNYSTNSIDSFEVTDEDGVKYNFYVADKASNSFIDDNNFDKNVAWLLSSINVPNKGTIYFSYNDLVTFSSSTIAEPSLRISRLYSNLMEGEQPYFFDINMINQCSIYKMRFLKKITYGVTDVTFNYQSDGKHISSVVVSDNGTTIKRFSFNVSNSTLNALTMTGTNTTDEQVYRFTYTNNNPGSQIDHWGNLGTSSSGYDIGNFNIFVDKQQASESDMNSFLSFIGNNVRKITPKTTDLQCYYKLKLQSSISSDGRVATSPDRHSVLSSIIYPNGGKTTFSFENHRFPTATASDGDFVFNRRKQRVIQGGGFRIKSIKNYTANGTLANQEEYRYGFVNRFVGESRFPLPLPTSYDQWDHTGYGEAVVDPNMLTYLSYDYSSARIPNGFVQMLLGIHVAGFPTFEWYSSGDGGAWWWEARFCANNFRRLLGGRRAVVYPEITVYHGDPDVEDGCVGKTVYKYDIYDYQLTPSRYYMSAFGQTAAPDTAYFEPIQYAGGSTKPLLVCEEYPARRDQLIKKQEYGKTGSRKYEYSLNYYEDYTYSEHQQQIRGWSYNSSISRGHCSGIHTMSSGENRNDLYIYLSEFYSGTYQKFGRSQLIEKTVTQCHSGTGHLTATEHYYYTLGDKIRVKTYWDNFNLTDTYSYAGNYTESDPVISSLINQHILTPVLSGTTEASVSNQTMPVSGFRVDYAQFNNGNLILPSKIYERNGDAYEESVQILSYTSHGNPQETIDLKTGITTTYIWGYDDRYLVIKAENATYGEVSNALGSISLGNNLTINQLNSVRNSLPNAMVQTWTYSPLIGVTSATDATGQTFTYQYDGLGRLKGEYRNVGGRTEKIHDYTYNYKN